MKLDFIHDINKDLGEAMDYRRVDRFMVFVHWASFAVLAAVTFLASVMRLADRYQSPLAWRVISGEEAMVVIAVGLVVTLIPTLLAGKMNNHYLWRFLVTVTLTTFAYLFVFVSGGSIEMHFTFFIMVALIAIYSDWRLGWFMLVLVTVHHLILNFIDPGWVFFYGRNDFAAVLHGALVLCAVIFTTIACESNRKSVRGLQEAEAHLDKLALKKDLEALLVALDMSALVSTTTAKGDITYVNDKFVEISKYSREELVGQNHRILKSGFHPPEFYKEMWDTIMAGKVWRGEIKNKTKDGSPYWVYSTMVPIMGKDGNPEKYISVRIPITDQKLAEEERVIKNQELERTNRLMVGRELAMTELKKRIKELEK